MFTPENPHSSFSDKLRPNNEGFNVTGSSVAPELRFVEVVPLGDVLRVGAAVDKGGNQSYSPATGPKEHLPGLVHNALRGAIGLRYPELATVQVGEHHVKLDPQNGSQQVSVDFEYNGKSWTETAESVDQADHRAYKATLTAMMNGYDKVIWGE